MPAVDDIEYDKDEGMGKHSNVICNGNATVIVRVLDCLWILACA